MPKVSIIVPVYNVEKYLRKCLDSLVSQTLKDIEIIIVNDGSPDNSDKIIDEYTKKFPNFKSYIKENGGQASARNYGLKKASGEYIGFVDSDDYVESNMFEKLYNKAKSQDFDVVACDTNLIQNGQTMIISSLVEKDVNSKEEMKKQMINFYPVVWNKIYKRELFNKETYFKEGVLFEDVEILYKLFPYIKSMGTVKEPLINYVQRENSTVNTFDNRLYDYIDNWNGLIDFYQKHNLYDEYKEELEYCYVRYVYATFIKGVSNFPYAKFKKAVDTAINNVKSHFPNYKQNKYFDRSPKSKYLLNFNKLMAKILYYKMKLSR